MKLGDALDLMKAKALPVGTIRNNRQKMPDGSWKRVPKKKEKTEEVEQKTESKTQSKEISPEEKDAVQEYKNAAFNSAIGGFTTIQGYLREGKPKYGEANEKEKKAAFDYAEKISNAINKSPLDKDTKFMRGLKHKTGNAETEAIYNLKPGDSFSDKGFMSTTSSTGVAKRFSEKLNASDKPIKMVFDLPKDYNILEVKKTLGGADKEKEFIIDKNAQFEVKSVKDSGGVRTITMVPKMNKLEKALDLLIKAKKYPIGTIRNGREKVAEGKWVPVSEGKSKNKKEDKVDHQKNHDQEESKRNMSEAMKYKNAESKLEEAIAQRKEIDPDYKVPKAAEEKLKEVKAKTKAHTSDMKNKKPKDEIDEHEQRQNMIDQLVEANNGSAKDYEFSSDEELKQQIENMEARPKDLGEGAIDGELVQVKKISDNEFEVVDKKSGEKWYMDSDGGGSIPEKLQDTPLEAEAMELIENNAEGGESGSGDLENALADELEHIADNMEDPEMADELFDVVDEFREDGVEPKWSHLYNSLRNDGVSKEDLKAIKNAVNQYQLDKEEVTEKSETKNAYWDLLEGLKKSLIMADGQGSAIDTADYTMDEAHSGKWLSIFKDTMENYNYGDAPREIELDNGYKIILSKVDEGLYSGFIRQTIDWDGQSPLEENPSKVEKQTIPAIIAFCKAKEYIDSRMEQNEPVSPIVDQPVIVEPIEESNTYDNRQLAGKLVSLLDRLI